MGEYRNLKCVMRKIRRRATESDSDYFTRVTNKPFINDLYESIISNKLTEEYVSIGNDLYKYILYTYEDNDSYIASTILSNGDIEFHTRYNIADTNLQEMLEDVINDKQIEIDNTINLPRLGNCLSIIFHILLMMSAFMLLQFIALKTIGIVGMIIYVFTVIVCLLLYIIHKLDRLKGRM